MHKLLPFPLCLVLLLGCPAPGPDDSPPAAAAERVYGDLVTSTPPDTLFPVYDDAEALGYRNQNGDTIVPFGRYIDSFSDTITTFGIVLRAEAGPRLAAINTRGEEIYDVYWYDNGPDYPAEGLFRILRNDQVGYADTTGRIVIEPQFACASPFEDGRARVTFDCREVRDHPDDEHTRMESDSWFYIDRRGQRVE